MEKNKRKKDSVFSGNQVMMMLEGVMDSIGILAESHKTLEGKMDQRFDKMDQRFDKFEAETNANFKSVFEYLSRIEDEIVDIKKELKNLQETKAENSMVLELIQRVTVMESEIKMLKKQKVV